MCIVDRDRESVFGDTVTAGYCNDPIFDVAVFGNSDVAAVEIIRENP